MFIRHPQDRIASAYNMLFGKSQDYAYDFNEARTLILKAITNITNSGTQDGLSFPKFVNFILNKKGEFSSVYKTFTWLQSHVEPFSTYCEPCSFLPEIIVDLPLYKSVELSTMYIFLYILYWPIDLSR